MFALNPDMLTIILEFLSENHPTYMTAILMKNHFGISPLEIAIENESKRTTEIMLRKLIYFKDIPLS